MKKNHLEAEIASINQQFVQDTEYVLNPDIQQVLLDLYLYGAKFDGWVLTLHEINMVLIEVLGPHVGGQYTRYLEYLLDEDAAKFAVRSTAPTNHVSLVGMRHFNMRDKLRNDLGIMHVAWLSEGSNEVDFLSQLVERGVISAKEHHEFLKHAKELIQSFAISSRDEQDIPKIVPLKEEIEEHTPEEPLPIAG